MVCINASESNECFRNERQLFDESAVLCWNRCPLNSVGSLRQVACSWRALAAAEALFVVLFEALGFRPPPPEDGHDLNYDLLLAGLPADPRVAWLRLNRGSFTVRRILALLRLGTHAIHFYHRAPEVDRPPAFVITFGVLGVSGCFVALEPDADVATFFLP